MPSELVSQIQSLDAPEAAKAAAIAWVRTLSEGQLVGAWVPESRFAVRVNFPRGEIVFGGECVSISADADGPLPVDVRELVTGVAGERSTAWLNTEPGYIQDFAMELHDLGWTVTPPEEASE